MQAECARDGGASQFPQDDWIVEDRERLRSMLAAEVATWAREHPTDPDGDR